MTWRDVPSDVLAQADQELAAARARVTEAVGGYVRVLDMVGGDSLEAFTKFLLPMIGAAALNGPNMAVQFNMALLMLAEQKRADGGAGSLRPEGE